MTLSQRTGVAEINTQWSFRFPLLVRIPIRKASFPKQSGTGMPSPIQSSPLLNRWMIAYLNSLPLLELGTYLPRPSPGEVLSFFGVSPVNFSDSEPHTVGSKSHCRAVLPCPICRARFFFSFFFHYKQVLFPIFSAVCFTYYIFKSLK